MELEETDLHPNWQALATIHFPRKVFIREGTSNEADEGTRKSIKYNLRNLNGGEIKDFYENVTKEPIKCKSIPQNRQTRKRDKKCEAPVKGPKISFNKNKFFRAATENNIEILELLDCNFENIDTTDEFGWTALMMAACEGALEAFVFLVENGANVDYTDRHGNNAQSLALRKNQHKILDVIEKFYKPERNEPVSIPDRQVKLQEFFCKLCKVKYKDVSRTKHETSTVHQFNIKRDKTKPHFPTSQKCRGFEMMKKQGWDAESGLGPSNQGQLYPVKTVIRKNRTGLGIKQDAAKVTHFKPYDLSAIKYHPPPRDKTRKEIYRERRRNTRIEKRLREELS